MKKVIALLLICAILLLCACSAPAATPEPIDASAGDIAQEIAVHVNEVIAAPVSEKSVADNIIAYRKCFDDITKINDRLRSLCIDIADGIEGDSFVCSPISLYISLCAAAEGASDGILDEVYSLLAPDGMTRERFRECIKTEIDYLTMQNGEMSDRLDIRTIALLSDEYKFDEEYADALAGYYNAAVGRGDLSSQELTERINKWADIYTNGTINPFLSQPLDEDIDFALMNSVYFLGEWQDKFSKDANEQGTFHGLNGDAEATFMRKFDASYAYAECEGYTSLVLPYQSGAVMRVYLPAEGKSARDVMNVLANGDEAQYGEALVTLKLPKFELQNDLDLKESLAGTGLEVLCDEASRPLGNVSPDGDMVLSSLVQKASIRVNEKGTEAAAVTMAGAEMFAARDDIPRVEFNVDRPFVYTIEKNGALLFLGVMNDLG